MVNSMLLINGPIKKYVRQQCRCENSRCVDDTKFVGDSTIQTTYDVCSVCLTPYHVEFDTSNITLIKNIGEEDAKGKKETNSQGT